MRKISKTLFAPASNDMGNAVAIVLLVLGVVSLLGAALLTQSRIDVKFVTAFKSHNTAFNLADGAAAIALTKLSFTTAPQYSGQPVSTLLGTTKYTGPTFVTQGGTPAGANLSDRGTYWPVMIFRGAITDPTKMAGWQLGREGRQVECWVAQGLGTRRDTSIANSGVATSDTQIRQGQHLPNATSVQMVVHKFTPQ